MPFCMDEIRFHAPNPRSSEKPLGHWRESVMSRTVTHAISGYFRYRKHIGDELARLQEIDKFEGAMLSEKFRCHFIQQIKSIYQVNLKDVLAVMVKMKFYLFCFTLFRIFSSYIKLYA